MGWLIFVGILCLLAAIPLGVSIQYNEDGFLVKVIAAFLRFAVFPIPRKKKAKKASAQKQNTKKPASIPEKKPSVPPSAAPAPRKGGSLTDFLPLVRVGMDFLRSFRRKLRMDRLVFHLVLAAEDPCDLAVGYGRAWAAVGNLMPVLERKFVIGKRDVEVGCDFTASETRVTAQLDLTITVGRLLSAAFVYGIRALIEFLRILKKRKGGASA